MIKKSFTLRVLIVSFLFLALPLLVDSFIFFQNTYYEAVADAKKDLKLEANFRAFNMMSLPPIRQVFLKEIIYILDLQDQLEKKTYAFDLNRNLMKSVHEGGAFQIYIMSIEKTNVYKVVASSEASLIDTYFISYQLREIFEKEEMSFIRYNYDLQLQKYIPHIFTAKLIKSKDTGRPLGVVMAVANIENQINDLVSPGKYQHNFSFAILSADGIIFAATDPKLKGQYFKPLSAEKRKEILSSRQLGFNQLADDPVPIIKSDDPQFFEFILNDQVQIAYQANTSIGNTTLISYSPTETIFGSAIRHFLMLYTVYGLILIVGAGITYWFSLWISKPLRQLSHKMTQVSAGELNARFKEEPFGFEINILGKLFNQTLDNLLTNIQYAQDERVKKETYQRELSIVRQVQHSLLPSSIPAVKGLEFAGVYLPAIDVGGDFYSYYIKKTSQGEEALIVDIADAAGQGISSSLYALSARGLLRTYATLTDDVGEILSLSNDAFIQDIGDTGMFLTIFTGMYHADSKIFSYYSCGHVPCFVKTKEEEVVTLAASGISMGLKKSAANVTDTIQLFPGDIVILYTYGVIAARNDQGECFTENRLKKFCQDSKFRSAQDTVDTIAAELQRYTYSKPQEKEMIIVALKVKDTE